MGNGGQMNHRIFNGGCLVVAFLLVVCCIGCGSASNTAADDGEDDFVLASDQQGRDAALRLLFPESIYNTITEKSRDNAGCKESNAASLGLPAEPNGQWYYTYENLIAGMAEMENFATESDDDNINKLEIAAFLANIAQETGGKVTGDPYGSPCCFIQEGGGSGRISCGYGGCVNTPGYDVADTCKANDNKCPAGDFGWCGRGPHQLSWTSNYATFGRVMGVGDNYRNDPDLLTKDPEIGIAGSIWFWGHEEQSASFPPNIPYKPSAHNVVVGKWTPTEFDVDCGRTTPGLGIITNIINGGLECGSGASEEGRTNARNRVNYFNAIADLMGVTVPAGWADDCTGQKDFAECPSYRSPTSRCGAGWTDAQSKCGTFCQSDVDCPDGETCFGSLNRNPCPNE